jgi:hypothetical protein
LINKDEKYISIMNKVVRLTEDDLKGLVERSAKKIIKENNNIQQIKFAQKELYGMGKNLSSIGLRLDGTRFYGLYTQMKDAMIKLNDELIKELRREK